jgi:hypothetical protein
MGGEFRTHGRERKLIRNFNRLIRHNLVVNIEMMPKQTGQECVGRQGPCGSGNGPLLGSCECRNDYMVSKRDRKFP